MKVKLIKSYALEKFVRININIFEIWDVGFLDSRVLRKPNCLNFSYVGEPV